ncbi:MAG: zf-HC2 domain-containing protein [Cyanobacteria bacterium SZAS TMP-1]|nr:zf-HC2 domain-containing protein [Cyanobacteria bacterium SZAS TMP-1]
MSCAETIPKLELMADDELTSEQAAQILIHIDECASCRDHWYELLALRQAVKDHAVSFQPSADFEEKLIKAIAREDWAVRSSRPKAAGSKALLYAAAALLLGVATAAILGVGDKGPAPDKTVAQNGGPNVVASLPEKTKPASLEDALSNFDQYLAGPAAAGSPAVAEEVASISKQAGFTVKTMQLPGFKLASAQLVVMPEGKSNLVRLCYTRTKGKGKDAIICYQSPGGKLVAEGLNEHMIDGRKICCGETKNKSIVYIPGQKSDSTEVLLVGTISKSDLMDLVLSSS